MTLERLLQIGTATLAMLGMLVLGMGQQDPKLPVLGAIVAISSVLLTDTLGWLRLRGAAANVAAVVAVVACAWDMSQRFDDQTRMLGLANVLAYLQFVLFYQEKNVSRYWLIAALSLLQVAVAAALNLEIAFGGLLLVYLIVAIGTLTLLHIHTLYQRQRNWQSSEQPANSVLSASHTPRPLRSPGFVSPRSTNPLSLLRRWSFAFEMLRICVVTLLLTAIVFPIVPRVGGSSMQPSDTTMMAATGYTETVKIGEAASISESPEAVMRVRFTDRGGAPYLLQGEPMLRGTWLARYDSGEWWGPSDDDGNDQTLRPAPEVGAELVRQQITIEPMTSNNLFGVWPLFLDESNSTNNMLRYDRRSECLRRPSSQRDEQLQYSTITTGFQSRHALSIVPTFMKGGRRWLQTIGLLQFPERELPTLAALADDLVADIPATDVVARARRLEAHFLQSNDYYYSFSTIPGDPSLDPAEDFVRNTHRGHCEYYATALTLMLRRVGIPARMVVGFKGGEWNPYGDFYLVRQLHAHAWVEAFVDRLPEDAPQQGANPANGGWLTLDPTPGRTLDATAASHGVAERVRQVADYAQFLWSSYVVRLDAGSQFQEIYLPIKNAAMSLFDPEFWQDGRDAITQFVREGRFSWPAAAATFLVGVIMISAYRVVRFVVRHVVRFLRRRRGKSQAGTAIYVEFYRRFTTMMKRLGLRRATTQTPRDFALLAQSWLASHGSSQSDAAAPLGIVEAYYRVRFGNQPLDSQEHAQVEQALQRLERAVSAISTAR
ncbi:MAG: DUF3488 and transglutaminase-like domain-containing protein [Pirellulales bacterium]